MHTLLTGTAPITADIFGNIQSGNKYLILQVIEYLNILKDKYQTSATAEEKCEILQKAKQILPESFLQKRTIDTNYAELRNMYFQRRDHRLPEWRDTFCNWIKTLPYAAELITYEGGV